MNDQQIAELVLKAIASVVALTGAFVAARKWLDQRRKDGEAARIESHKPFSIKQQEIYLEFVNVTAIISNLQDKPEWEVAIARFWTMFWGVIPMVADQDVAKATNAFSVAMDNMDNRVGLRNASMDLARACRRSLGATWKADLGEYEKYKRQIAS